MSVLLARGTAALIRTRVAVRRFGGHGHGDGKYTFDREFRRCFSRSPVVRMAPRRPARVPPPACALPSARLFCARGAQLLCAREKPQARRTWARRGKSTT